MCGLPVKPLVHSSHPAVFPPHSEGVCSVSGLTGLTRLGAVSGVGFLSSRGQTALTWFPTRLPCTPRGTTRQLFFPNISLKIHSNLKSPVHLCPSLHPPLLTRVRLRSHKVGAVPWVKSRYPVPEVFQPQVSLRRDNLSPWADSGWIGSRWSPVSMDPTVVAVRLARPVSEVCKTPQLMQESSMTEGRPA